MKRQLLFFFLCIVNSIISFAQPSFVRSYGGADTEIPQAILLLPDSGYVITGSTRSFGPNNVNIYIMRLDKYGDTLWTKVIGNGGENGRDVILLDDHQELILANGQSMLPGNSSNLMKMDLNGNLIWSRAYGGSSVDNIFDVLPTIDNGFIAVGYSTSASAPYSNVFVMKTDSAGILQWCRHYGGLKWDYGYSIEPVPAGGYIIAGSTSSFNNAANNAPDAILLRINLSGDTLWAKRYSDAPYIVGGSSVIVLPDGFLLAGGMSDSVPGMTENIILIRTDTVGDTLWTKQYRKPLAENIAKIIHTSDNGFLIAGQTASSAFDWDIYLIRTDSLGDTLWTRGIGGTEHDVARDIIKAGDNFAILSQSVSFSVTGTGNDYDMVLSFIDSNGYSSCFQKELTAMTVTTPNIVVANFSPSIIYSCSQLANTPQITYGATLIDWCTPQAVHSIDQQEFIMDSYPNPFDDKLIFTTDNNQLYEIVLYDIVSRKLLQQTFMNTAILNTEQLASGFYIYEVRDKNGKVANGKVIKQ